MEGARFFVDIPWALGKFGAKLLGRIDVGDKESGNREAEPNNELAYISSAILASHAHEGSAHHLQPI